MKITWSLPHSEDTSSDLFSKPVFYGHDPDEPDIQKSSFIIKIEDSPYLKPTQVK